MYEFGKVIIHLDKLLEQSGLSKNKFAQRAEMQHLQITNYCNNNVARLDIDVLARICKVLNCKIEDLLEYVPPETERHEE